MSVAGLPPSPEAVAIMQEQGHVAYLRWAQEQNYRASLAEPDVLDAMLRAGRVHGPRILWGVGTLPAGPNTRRATTRGDHRRVDGRRGPLPKPPGEAVADDVRTLGVPPRR